MRDDRAKALADWPQLRLIESELSVYADLLRRWQTRINLVGPSTVDLLWSRHFADSIQLVPFVANAAAGRTGVDLGSGAGFPGLVLALALKPAGIRVTLVESDTRKAAFLREVSRETSAPVEVRTDRAATFIGQTLPPGWVTSRALTPLDTLMTLTRPWLAAGTRGAFLAGESEATPPAAPDLCITRTRSRTGRGFVVEVRRNESRQV